MALLTPGTHQAYVRALYKSILAEGSRFFDDRARTFIVNRARKLFKEYITCTDEARIQNKLAEARKRLHRIERANQGDLKSALKVLEAAYGRTGKTKHKLLHPFVYANFPEDMVRPEPLVPHVPHTAPPPPLSKPVCALVRRLKKPLEPKLPESPYKPLHRGRQANLLWKWRSNLLERIEVPLPFEIGCELETKSGLDPLDPRGAANTLKGGPRWDEMYGDRGQDADIMHLCPTSVLVPLSRLQRRPAPPSPYTAGASPYATLSMVHLLDPSFDVPLETTSVPVDPRTKRRLYRRLLVKVPYLSPLPTASKLWDNTSYTATSSCIVPTSVLNVLQDEDISEESLRAFEKKKRGRK
ncbi:hypothetical protein J3Q64DRAFT_1392180 [Phycomyces blakesleeanus]|uniref:LYR motif-containing protein Cup1-like N-terminal domain-containing protein n=1 Tax=Phycomyces blakesleeanus TaxID=4837 RepID=A0ABR3B3X9_PHYBL